MRADILLLSCLLFLVEVVSAVYNFICCPLAPAPPSAPPASPSSKEIYVLTGHGGALILWRLRQKGSKFKAILDHVARPSFKENKKQGDTTQRQNASLPSAWPLLQFPVLKRNVF